MSDRTNRLDQDVAYFQLRQMNYLLSKQSKRKILKLRTCDNPPQSPLGSFNTFRLAEIHDISTAINKTSNRSNFLQNMSLK